MRNRNLWLSAGLAALLILGGAALPAFAQAAPAAKTAKAPETTLVFWHWWTDYQPFFEEIAERYRMETGVKVEFQLISSAGSDYLTKLQAAAQANTLPDLVGMTDNPELLARYAKADRLMELTRELKADNMAWEYSFLPRVMNSLFFPKNNLYGVKGNSYWGVPLSAMNIQIYYNKKLFRKAGLDPSHPPQTWRQFLTAGEKLKQAGVPVLLAGEGDLWVNNVIFRAYAWPLLGEDKMRSLYLGELPYTSNECREVLKYFQAWRDQGFFYPGSVSLSNKEAEILFSQNKAAMMINGSWAVNVFAQMNPELEYGVIDFPRPDQAPFPMYTIGGLDRAAIVTANAREPKAAVQFLRWLTALPQQLRWARVPFGYPAVLEAQTAIHPKLEPFVNRMNHLAPNLFLEERAEVIEALNKGMQSFLLNDRTLDQVLMETQERKQDLKARETGK